MADDQTQLDKFKKLGLNVSLLDQPIGVNELVTRPEIVKTAREIYRYLHGDDSTISDAEMGMKFLKSASATEHNFIAWGKSGLTSLLPWVPEDIKTKNRFLMAAFENAGASASSAAISTYYEILNPTNWVGGAFFQGASWTKIALATIGITGGTMGADALINHFSTSARGTKSSAPQSAPAPAKTFDSVRANADEITIPSGRAAMTLQIPSAGHEPFKGGPV